MPWTPELFSAPARERLEEKLRDLPPRVPYFSGLMSGEIDALVGSFAGEPQLHDPVRGRVRGRDAFAAFVSETSSWLRDRGFTAELLEHAVAGGHGFEEFVVRLAGPGDPIELPFAVVSDLAPDGRMVEVRIYFSSWALSGRHLNRPPLLQADPRLQMADVVGEYQRALAAGDAEAILDTFEADGYAREPAGEPHVHRGSDDLRSFYELLFSNGGGIPLEHCTVIDDGRCCAVEYNVVRWGTTELSPQAGVAVYERGADGRLAAARIYDDTDPPVIAGG